MSTAFEIIVIGGGHAGCEAAAVAARMGARVALVTTAPAEIGAMSCNPSIGGVGKGHLVRELDVFDGLMARAADQAAIHYRMLNRSKGPAVHGPRIQADRLLYRRAVKRMMAEQAGLSIIAGHAERLHLCAGKICGIVLADGPLLEADAVLLATGTFLGGKIFRGSERQPGGRVHERPATALAQQLRDLGLPMRRLKTGTPPRLDGRTIDWSRLAVQPSDDEPWCMSAISARRAAPQIACAVTRTNVDTHSIIRDGLDRSPLLSGDIEGRGPRYCPSIEDKITRFGDREGHQLFLEPEGLSDPTVYPNGISTSLPLDVQIAMVRSIAGLERAEVVQAGYAVEYDYLDPRALDNRLHLRALPGLYCAGQINGTTGYEEAAAQGLAAGINAAAITLGREPIIFDRADSYIGVMIDDLTIQGVSEPYRMLTARAEHRLHLRADNAVTRLGEQAAATGALSEQRRWANARHLERHHEGTERFSLPARSGTKQTLGEWVRQRDPTVEELLREQPDLNEINGLLPELLADARYEPYVERQRAEVARLVVDSAVFLTRLGSYSEIAGLSNEMVERLEAARPETLAAASRVRGITPAALTAILIAARRAAA